MREDVVLIHGLFMHGIVLRPMARYLEKEGFHCHRFSYASLRLPLKENVRLLSDFVNSCESEVVHFVGHSLGGLLIRALFAWYGVNKSGRIVMLGTPNKLTRVQEALGSTPLGAMLLGKSLPACYTEGSQWPKLMRETGLIAGSRSVGAGRLFATLPAPNDGTVTLDETGADDITETKILPVTHTTMLFSSEVFAQTTRFLRSGRFF